MQPNCGLHGRVRRRIGDTRALDTVNLLSISPDCVTADELAQLALEAADGGFALDGVVVVNPDPSDTTSGLLATTRSASCLLMRRGTGRPTSGCDWRRCHRLQRLAGAPFESGALMDADHA